MGASKLYGQTSAHTFASRSRRALPAVSPWVSRFLFVCLALSSCGCQVLRGQDRSRAAELLEYGASLRNLDRDDFTRLYSDLTLDFRESPSAAAAIRLALLFSYPDSGHYDLDDAISLLRSAETALDAGPGDRSLASLLLAVCIETRELALEHERTRLVATRDAQTVSELRLRLDEVAALLVVERERGETLRRQLNALVQLEEQLDPAGGVLP